MSLLSQAAIDLAKRESISVVAATGLLFQGLSKRHSSLALTKLVVDYRTGVWGEETPEGTGTPVLRSTNMRGGRVDVALPAWCNISPSKASACRLESGDILVAKSSGSPDLVGKACLFVQSDDTTNYVFSNFILRLRPETSLVLPEYVGWFLRSPQALSWRYETQLNGVGLRNLQTNNFMSQLVPVPSHFIQAEIVHFLNQLESGDNGWQNLQLHGLEAQRHQLIWIDALATMIEEAQKVEAQIESESQRLLQAAFKDISESAPRRKLGDIAPLNRRPVIVDPFASYPGVSVRSFGRGTFHNPPLPGSEITWEKPFQVRAGDILVSNIKAWEGAIAVATPEDEGRYGSHRYLTYRPVEGVATARFVCFYLLTSEGLHHVGEGSPGSADRNRTTSAKALEAIPVPLPNYERQLWFGQLHDKVEAIRQLQTEAAAGREALLAAILDRAFRGEL